MTTFDSAHATDNITFDMYNQVYEGLYTYKVPHILGYTYQM